MIFRSEEEEKPKTRRRIIEEDDREWDKRKILVALILIGFILIIGFEARGIFTNSDSEVLGRSEFNRSEIEKPKVKSPQVDIENQVESTILDIKESINSLDANEVATSSPQIQKVLKDIQGIKDLPSNQAKEMCLKLCSGI